ncbi:hypothetical protein SAMN04487944_10997 [Gracilibacillus ureilyticus]|uniref:SPOR domain-containing protein n=1 Tax=Gracilibacillus ureilyticus TaxID=531814 RepID=A0A1H9RQK7_9BACI|nr:SPOR domain-containing protein [Gracilibacillus ureilyticus]SER74765.1 hypothetical protein SAMN04487944_10997 [Gracilibacillus ureilyticus]
MKNNNRISVQINHQKRDSKKDPIEHLLEQEKKPVNYDTSPPVFQSVNRPAKPGFWTTYRSFIYAALTAIIIGTFLGFIMLKIFVDMDPEEVSFQNSEHVTSTVTASEGTKEVEQPDSNLPVFKSNTHQAYVVQAGVFTSESAAIQLQNELKASNIPAMIWNRDNQYHLFTSVHSTSEASKKYLEAVKSDVEMYGGKAWTTVPVEVSVTESEKKWLQSFDTLLPALLESKDVSGLEEWMAKKPAEISSTIESFVKKTEELSGKEKLDSLSVLEIWYQYSKITGQ